ncbi:MAG: methyltransferase [Balneola sp.]|nr:MAG: methyltransferase [Balneola sp.]
MNSIDQQVIQTSQVRKNFSASVSYYHEHAVIQKKVAEGLIASIKPWKDIIPPGPVLEVGCGTGFVSEHIVNEFPNREIVISDLSADMVDFTSNKIGKRDGVVFEVLDVNDFNIQEYKYALIVSNFAAQWFDDPATGLDRLTKSLKPGGLLITAFPGNHSFAEWYECCLELGLPFTANTLPDVEEVVVKLSLNPVQIDYYENDLYQEFESSLGFFQHLKKIGAHTSKTGKSLNTKQLRLLTSFWDKKKNGDVKVKWHVVYLAVKKEMR